MDTDLAMQMVTMRTAATQNSVQLAVFKKTQEMEASLLTTLLQSSVPPAPAGQGLRIDKQAWAMGNAMGIGPAVMVNRIVDRVGTPGEAQLAKVAELSQALRQAVADEQAEAALVSPTGEAEKPIVDNGAAVDRLI